MHYYIRSRARVQGTYKEIDRPDVVVVVAVVVVVSRIAHTERREIDFGEREKDRQTEHVYIYLYRGQKREDIVTRSHPHA